MTTPHHSPIPRPTLLGGLLGYAALVAAVALLWERPVPLLLALLLLAALTLGLLRSRRLLAFFVVGAALGPGAEAIAIAAGAWAYTHTEGLLVPVWLPPAWGLAATYLVVIVDAALGRFDRSGDRG